MRSSEKPKTELPLDRKVEVFKQSERFAHLSDNELREIASLAVTRHFKKRELIFHEEDAPRFFYIVEHGRVKLFRKSLSGKNFIGLIATASNSLDSYVLFGGKAHDLSGQAMDDERRRNVK